MPKAAHQIHLTVPINVIEQAIAWGNRLIEMGEQSPSTQTASIPQLVAWLQRMETKARLATGIQYIPRRSRIDLMTPAEVAIRNARLAVEEAGCDVLLTDAVNLLHQAQDKVANYVDRVGERE